MRISMVILICLLLVVPCTAEVIVCFPMDSDPDWTTEGQWEFGVPQGGGGPQSYDPTSGYTGANVYGYNLAGNYENNIAEYCLTTSALNCTLAENVNLSFWRWLGVESSLFDHAKIQVSNNGTNWTDVWVNGEGNLADSSWVYCEYNISAVADGQPTVFIRWCMGPTDFSAAYAGWNIDDVCLDGDLLDALVISPNDSFFSFGPEGGPFSPACKSCTLTNEGTSALNWTAEGTQSWLDVTPGGGTLAPGASVPVEMCINSTANTLTEGRYTDTVRFTNTNSGFSHLIDVTLYVYVGHAVFVPLHFPTIQSAINNASNGDTIVVLDGVYTGNGNRDIDFNGRAITLKSVSGPESCIINCQGNVSHPHRGFYFHSGETSQSVVEGFTVTGGWVAGSGAGIYCAIYSSPTISNCIITGNKADVGYGGSPVYGGGIYCEDSSPTISNCIISENEARAFFDVPAYGGGIYCNNSSPTIRNCIIKQNKGGMWAGGIYCRNNSCPVITKCTFFRNHCSGMYNDHSNPILTNCTFESNYSGGGGGMYNRHSNPILTNCTFRSNRADDRGGMSNYYSNPTLTNCIFTDNYAHFSMDEFGNYYGGVCGGMYNDHSDPTLTNCIFEGNYARGIENVGGLGGGMFNSYSNPILTNCTFTGNKADSGYGLAGGMYNSIGKPTLTNCIFWGNSDEGGMDESAQIHTTGVGGPVINYSCIQGLDTFAGHGNIGEDPCFADTTNDDYHLQSAAGRWDPNQNEWVYDVNTSLCIDAGDPHSDWAGELWPHGKRINMGAYGGTSEASMSASDLGNVADVSNDDSVNYTDMMLFTDKWLYEVVLLAEDLDRDGIVNFIDFAIFAGNWLWEQ